MTATTETTVTPVTSLKPDTILQNRYRIVRQLGKGGMGAVYEAIDERLDITVALKETLSSEDSVRKQFAQEARLLARMQHPALPRVTDHFTEGDRAFLVMQFVGGVDLARIIAQQPGPFPRDQVIAWADQLLDALMYLHSRDRQVIHRDIKPHNLKLTATGQIALLDFGLAKAQPSDPSATTSAAFFGYTRQYAPLEQIQDRTTDTRSDIYALGATLYHLLTGVKPPDALVRAAALVNGEADPLRPANHVHHIVGEEIAAILMKAMAQKPEERFATASEFREALRRVGRHRTESDEDNSDERGPKIDMIVSGKRFGPGSATILIIAVALLAAGVLYGSQNWFSLWANAPEMSATIKRKTPTTRSDQARAEDSVKVEQFGGELVKRSGRSVAKMSARKGIVARSVAKRREPQGKIPTLNAPTIRLPETELTEMR